MDARLHHRGRRPADRNARGGQRLARPARLPEPPRLGRSYPAIAKVLALEQGDTDKLCEYSPKALLELVFDVFGDKEVLDNYATAREEQINAERELADLAVDLDRLRAQADAKRLEADRFLEWKQLSDEASALEAEIVPRLEATELASAVSAERIELARLAVERQARRTEQRAARDRLAVVRQEREQAENRRSTLRRQDLEADQAHLLAHDGLRDIEAVGRARALRVQLAAEHGADAVQLEREHERSRSASMPCVATSAGCWPNSRNAANSCAAHAAGAARRPTRW